MDVVAGGGFAAAGRAPVKGHYASSANGVKSAECARYPRNRAHLLAVRPVAVHIACHDAEVVGGAVGEASYIVGGGVGGGIGDAGSVHARGGGHVDHVCVGCAAVGGGLPVQ